MIQQLHHGKDVITKIVMVKCYRKNARTKNITNS